MLNRTVVLAAVAVGLATSFLELTVVGMIAGIVAVWLGVRGRIAREAPGR